jgi:hypothetical protein
MLAAGHVSLSSFQDKEVVTLLGSQQVMTRINPISCPLNPMVCEQLFNNTPALVKSITSNKTTSTSSTNKVSSSSSHTTREPTYALASYSQTIDLMHKIPPQLSTPSLTHHNHVHHSH